MGIPLYVSWIKTRTLCGFPRKVLCVPLCCIRLVGCLFKKESIEQSSLQFTVSGWLSSGFLRPLAISVITMNTIILLRIQDILFQVCLYNHTQPPTKNVIWTFRCLLVRLYLPHCLLDGIRSLQCRGWENGESMFTQSTSC